jgi:hypothetical protein
LSALFSGKRLSQSKPLPNCTHRCNDGLRRIDPDRVRRLVRSRRLKIA